MSDSDDNTKMQSHIMSLRNPTSQSPGVDMNKMVQVDSGHFEDRATSNEDFISPNPGSFSRII